MPFWLVRCLQVRSIFVNINYCSPGPDPPDFLSRYSIIEGSDYQQQTAAVNLIDDMLISELNRIICYNQTIYDDTLVEPNEYLGLSLGVEYNPSTTSLTLVKPMYDKASILILDNDGKNLQLL